MSYGKQNYRGARNPSQNGLGGTGMMVKETKHNFCEVKEMMIGQDKKIGEMVNSWNALDGDVKIALIWGRLCNKILWILMKLNKKKGDSIIAVKIRNTT